MIINSKVVPTEYDVAKEKALFGERWVLTDDHNRKFTGITLHCAFAKAERAQDPTDPIHHV